MKLLRMNEVSEITGLAQSTLRLMHRKGELVPAKISSGGTRYYSDEQIKEYMGIETVSKRIVIGYARVSSRKQEDDLNKQIENLKTYMFAKGYSFEMITDIGSSANYSRNGLTKLLERIHNGEVSKVVILYKDRLVRFGFELLETVCKLNDCEIEIVDNTPKTDEEELVNDLVKVVNVFGSELKGEQSKIIKQFVEGLKDDTRGSR
jgi:DNA binding domain, excisionase family